MPSYILSHHWQPGEFYNLLFESVEKNCFDLLSVEQVRSAGQPTWGAHPPASQPTVNTTETSWANNPTAEPREESKVLEHVLGT